MDNISEIALRCDDVSFRDFDKGIYERCLLRATRVVARRYQIIQRITNFDIKISIPEGETEDDWVDQEKVKPVPLSLMSFTAEHRVIINGNDYLKVGKLSTTRVTDMTADIDEYGSASGAATVSTLLVEDYNYILYRDHNSILFNYSPRTKDDSVEIWYTADINEEDYDLEELQPVIPSQYTEELLALSVTEVAKLGIPKFGKSDKGTKYVNLMKVYGLDENVLNNDLHKNDAWTVMKVNWSS